MNSKLYLGNLSNMTTADTLWRLFAQSGSIVSLDLIEDQLTKKSRGYAFIVMSNRLEAEKAIEMFDGFSLDGSQIRVSFARRLDNRDGFSDSNDDKSIDPVKRRRNKRT